MFSTTPSDLYKFYSDDSQFTHCENNQVVTVNIFIAYRFYWWQGNFQILFEWPTENTFLYDMKPVIRSTRSSLVWMRSARRSLSWICRERRWIYPMGSWTCSPEEMIFSVAILNAVSQTSSSIDWSFISLLHVWMYLYWHFHFRLLEYS